MTDVSNNQEKTSNIHDCFIKSLCNVRKYLDDLLQREQTEGELKLKENKYFDIGYQHGQILLKNGSYEKAIENYFKTIEELDRNLSKAYEKFNQEHINRTVKETEDRLSEIESQIAILEKELDPENSAGKFSDYTAEIEKLKAELDRIQNRLEENFETQLMKDIEIDNNAFNRSVEEQKKQFIQQNEENQTQFDTLEKLAFQKQKEVLEKSTDINQQKELLKQQEVFFEKIHDNSKKLIESRKKNLILKFQSEKELHDATNSEKYAQLKDRKDYGRIIKSRLHILFIFFVFIIVMFGEFILIQKSLVVTMNLPESSPVTIFFILAYSLGIGMITKYWMSNHKSKFLRILLWILTVTGAVGIIIISIGNSLVLSDIFQDTINIPQWVLFIMLVALTTIFAGFGGLLFAHFFEMYETYINSGKGFIFPFFNKVLLRRKTEVEEIKEQITEFEEKIKELEGKLESLNKQKDEAEAELKNSKPLEEDSQVNYRVRSDVYYECFKQTAIHNYQTGFEAGVLSRIQGMGETELMDLDDRYNIYKVIFQK
jgi:peptidoglycan hydrolase CwlO-like protein